MRRDLIFNIVGKIWSILSGFLFVPFYIKLLGFSSFSFISFSLVLYNIVLFLDLGISASVGREMARKDLTLDEKRRTFTTLETIYFLISLTVILIFIIFQENIAYFVGKNSEFDVVEIASLLQILGFELGLQLLFRFAISVLIGFENHLLSNLLQILWSLFRNGGVVLILFMLPKLEVFLAYQGLVTLLFSLLSIYLIRRKLFSSWYLDLLRFEFNVIQRLYRFALGMLLVTVVSTLNTQVDKLILTNYFDLNIIGYYNLAFTLSSLIIVVVAPIGTTLLPRLTSLVSLNRHQEVNDLYVLILKIVGMLSIGIISVLYLWGPEILELWIGDLHIALNVDPFLKVIVFSSGLLALGTIPFNLAIANGYTRILNIVGVTSLVVSLPSYFIIANNYEAIGVVLAATGIQVISSLFLIVYLSTKFLDNRKTLIQILTSLVSIFVFGSLVFLIGRVLGNFFLKEIHWIAILLFTSSVYVLIGFRFIFDKTDRALIFRKRV